ncbi:MAG TPA: peptidylprolyl isomerase [Verrucomicrobiae bacterium]
MKTILKGVFVCLAAFAFNAFATTPIITSQPQSVVVNNASAANFTVAATNASSYQWLFGTNSLAGETNTTLTVDDVATNQEGFYSVVITSPTGETTNSQPAQLTVIPGTIVILTLSKFPDGSSMNIRVQLFDHDKPATVENFLHYITSGSFSNTFIERDVTNFVIQGGDYVTSDRSNSAGINGNYVNTGTNVFPKQLENEFGYGPLIHNRFGTLAMGLVSGNTNSATDGFFFNTADNSGTLDVHDFVVFGRMLRGTNVLQYFNGLSAPSNGIYALSAGIPTLPVNYNGTNAPADQNLFYCDFSFLSPAPVDTTPPTIGVTFPSQNAAFASGNDVTITGTAADNFGLANVYCVLTALSGVNANESETNFAVGTTSWSLDVGDLFPGAYEVTAYSQDGMGNISAPESVFFTNMVQLTIITNAGGQLTSNSFLYVPGGQYSVTAQPGPGELFESWENQGVISLDPVQTFTAETNFALTVNLVSNSLPAGLAITSPANGATVQTTGSGDLAITGTVPSDFGLTVTCQLFFQSNAVSAAAPVTIEASTWSFPASNLVSGAYTVQVIATDSAGRQGFVTETFNAVFTGPTITSQPASQTVNAGSTASFSAAGDNVASYQWKLGGNNIPGATNSTLTLEDVTTNQAGAYTVTLTSSTGDFRFSQPAQLTVVQGTIVQLALSGYAGGGTSNVMVELFDHDKPATVQNFLHYIVSGAYTNLFWSKCIPGSILQAGDYSTTERKQGAPPNLTSILTTFTQSFSYTPPFPFQLDDEFAVGPLIHNTFGTIAMQKTPGETNSATSVFFFNLTDNSSSLDSKDGGAAVFGRILSGSEVLSYFNTLSLPTVYTRLNASAGPTNGLFNSGSEPFTSVPVNYYGIQTPGDSNLIYVDFSFPTPPVIDTNLPTVALTYPTASNPATNRQLTMSGTASDDFGIARVVASITSPTSASGEAIGTTNWSFNFGNVAPGTNTVYIVAQDGAGNISTPLQTSFVMPQFPVDVSTGGPGTLSRNLTTGTTTFGSNYVVKATPSKGALFVDWSQDGIVSINPTKSFTMPNGLDLTALFVPNTMPGGISFSYPTANAKVAATNFTLTGKIAKSAGQTTVTARIFSKSSSESVTDAMTASGTLTWSIPNIQLAPGDYIAQALASNALGQTTVITEDFTVLTPLKINIEGLGTTSIADGTYLEAGNKYTVRATAKPGSSFYGWMTPGGLNIAPGINFTMASGTEFTAMFITNSFPKTLSFTYPKPNVLVTTNNFKVTGNVSASINNPQIFCELFSGFTQVGGIVPAIVNGSSWSAPFTGITKGSYTVVAVATDSSDAQTIATENLSVNLFPAIAGTYYGVFYATNIATNNAGLFKFTVNNSGLMTGKLQFPIVTFSVATPLSSAGTASLSGTGFGGTTLYLGVNFNLTNGSDSVTGYVDSVGTYATFTGYRAVTQLPTNTVAGKYLLNLDTVTNLGVADPTNDGFAALTVGKTGALTLSGTLADNTTFTEGVGVSKDGVWPVFAPLYKGHGLLIGWETNVISASGSPGTTGTIYWVKAPTKDTYFTNGLNLQISGFGTNYVAPLPGSQYQVVFGGGTVNPAITNVLTVSAAHQFVPAAGSPDKLTLSLSTAGVITGKLLNPADNATLQLHGSFGNPTVGGSGFILDTDGKSDSFVITPLQ